jgi:WD40 repeat protein/tRNA A-37 threonylcarbamoyl transferase component Bud32
MSGPLANAHPDSEQLRRFGSGELSGAEAGAVEAHVAACAECCQRLRELPVDPLVNRLQAIACTGDTSFPAAPMPIQPTLRDAPANAASGPEPAAQPPSVPGYEVLEKVGRGGMGVVYKARDVKLNRIVALKTILPGSQADAEQLVRFLAEAEAVAQLQHPNIVPIYEIGLHQELPYFTLEFVSGGNLAERLNGVPLPARQAAGLVEQLAQGIHSAHQHGIVHRDLKPQNVLLSEDGTPKITDFGLVKRVEAGPGLTVTGAVMGTPSYMAPEQAEGKKDVGRPADVYALGAVLYECLTGRPPFRADSLPDTLVQVVNDEPVPPSRLNAKVPRDLETICLKCLRKEPGQRYGGAADLADDLGRFLAGQPVRARPVGRLERGRRWCRRNPVVACLLTAVALLLSLVAVVSTVASFQLRSQLQRAESAEHAEGEAKREALAKLWGSYLSQARANRMTRQPGQRFATLRAIQEAMKLPLPEWRSLDELRTEAIAALCLPDLEVERAWKLDLKFPGPVFTIADTFERYASADKDGNVSVRRLDDHTELCRLAGEGRLDGFDRFSPDGRFLVQQCRAPAGWRCRLWKLDGAKPAVMLSAGESTWEFSPDSRQCAVFDHQAREMRIYDLETGRKLRRFQCDHAGCLRWNPRRPLLAHCTPTGWRTINVETGKVVAEATIPGICQQVAWHPEGRLLAAHNDTTHQITIWDTQRRQLVLPPLEGHRHAGIVFRFNHAGDLLLSNDWTNMWRLWDARTGKQLLTQPAGWGHPFCFRSDDALVGPNVDGRGRVRLFRLRRGNEFRTLVRRQSSGIEGYGGGPVDDAGRLLAVDTREGVALVDVLRGEEVALLPLPGNRPLRFEARGEAVWTFGSNGVLRWPIQTDPADGNKRRVGPPQRMDSTTTTDGWGSSPDLNLIAIPKYNRGALLWQRAANRTLSLGPQYDVRNCAVSPDGRWVATGSHWYREGAGAKVWDAQTRLLQVLTPVGSG